MTNADVQKIHCIHPMHRRSKMNEMTRVEGEEVVNGIFSRYQMIKVRAHPRLAHFGLSTLSLHDKITQDGYLGVVDNDSGYCPEHRWDALA
jgi:hypothetical protein